MPFIPNELDAFHPSQASPDSGDLEILRAASDGTGVVSGGEVTAQGTPDMTVAVPATVVAVLGAKAPPTSAGNVTITTADATDPRIDLIVVSSAGVKSAVAGDPAPEMSATEPGPVFPAIPALSVVLASVYVPATDTTIAQNQITDKRVFVVPPEPTTNYDLAKARDIPLVKERSQTVTLDTGQNLVHALLLAKNKLFATTQTSPTQFIRFNNLDDLTDRTSFTFASDGFHDSSDAATYVAETDRVYVLFDHASRITVAEVNPDTHATTDVISDTSHGGAGTNGSICSDGTHLYVATLTTPAKVVKYTLAGTFVAELTLTHGQAHAIMCDGVDLFVTGTSSPAWIARVDRSAMTAVEADFATGMNIATDDLASVGEHVWVGVEVANNLNVLRVEKASLATQTKVGYGSSAVWGVHFDGRYVWSAAGQIYRIDPLTLDQVEVVSGITSPSEIVSDGAGRLFISAYLSPSTVTRLHPLIPTTKRIGMPNLPVGGSFDTVLPMGKRFIDSATRTTSGTSEATLGQMSVAGNLLNVDGMMLRVTVAGSFAANANNKRIAIRLGASNYMFDTGLLPFNDARWKFMLEITRTGAATQDWSAFFISDSSVMATDVQVNTAAADLTVLQFLAVRGQTPTAAGDVTQEQMMVEVIS